MEQIIELADQLSTEDRQILLTRLQSTQPPLTAEERIARLRSMVIDLPISPEFSFDRKDWYDDERRAGLAADA
ncbi:MAG: hypothetical protein JNM70_16835 [Anaerolineae bacterium]|nr:hypothetical protein [Anaerolineae bacterium]